MNNQENLFGQTHPNIFTVSSLTGQIKELLEENFDFIWIEAEISNFRSPSSGHYYMVFKDEYSQIRAVMFRPQTRYINFTPEDGMKVIARGRITVYQPRGEYQVVIDYIEPLGVGAMAMAFEQLKKKLADQGIFDEEKKRPLPFLPRHVVVITSPTGAAIRDFLNVIHRRFANLEINLIPVKVQGEGAAEEICAAIETANRELKGDVIVITRGGGSMEDLWPFNNERLAHSIRASAIPVVSAVGHEIDTTISDLAADLRAPTPSAAAELLVAEKDSFIKYLGDIRDRLKYGMNVLIKNCRGSLKILSKGIRDPRKDIADSWLRLEDLYDRLIRSIRIAIGEGKSRLESEGRALYTNSPLRRISLLKETNNFQKKLLKHIIDKKINDKRMLLDLYEEKIKDLGPYSVLKRGYSITRTLPDKTALRSSSVVIEGERVNIILSEGELNCVVENVKE
jgi:exodeoxyribonuclease VII large subunit